MGFWLFSFHVKRDAEIKLFHVKHRFIMLILAVSTGVLAYFSIAFVHYSTLLFKQIWHCFSLDFSFFLVLILALKPLIYLNGLPALQPHHKLILLIFHLQLIPHHSSFYDKLYTLQMRPPITVSGYAWIKHIYIVKLQFPKNRYFITVWWCCSRFFLYVTRETILNFCRFCGYIDLFSSYYGNIEITASEKFRVLTIYTGN